MGTRGLELAAARVTFGPQRRKVGVSAQIMSPAARLALRWRSSTWSAAWSSSGPIGWRHSAKTSKHAGDCYFMWCSNRSLVPKWRRYARQISPDA